MTTFRAAIGAAALLAASGLGAQAGTIAVELNTLEEQQGACRVTFVARSDSDSDISALIVETVLFTRAGRVAQLTLFDFGALPAGRTRVRQFDLAGLACADLGQVLFNDIARCEGSETSCTLAPSSTVDGVEAQG